MNGRTKTNISHCLTAAFLWRLLFRYVTHKQPKTACSISKFLKSFFFFFKRAQNKGHVETGILVSAQFRRMLLNIHFYFFWQGKYSDRSCVGQNGVHILFPRHSYKSQVLKVFEQKQSWSAKFHIYIRLNSCVEHRDVQTLKTERNCDCVCTSLKWDTQVLLFHAECNAEPCTYVCV